MCATAFHATGKVIAGSSAARASAVIWPPVGQVGLQLHDRLSHCCATSGQEREFTAFPACVFSTAILGAPSHRLLMGKARVWPPGMGDWSPRLGQQHRCCSPCHHLNQSVGAFWGWRFSAFAETQPDSRKELLLIISVIQSEPHLPLFKQASVDPLGNNKKEKQQRNSSGSEITIIFGFFVVVVLIFFLRETATL